jgi:hypothetical protein
MVTVSSVDQAERKKRSTTSEDLRRPAAGAIFRGAARLYGHSTRVGGRPRSYARSCCGTSSA